MRPNALPPHIAKLSQTQVTASGKTTSQVAAQERSGPASSRSTTKAQGSNPAYPIPSRVPPAASIGRCSGPRRISTAVSTTSTSRTRTWVQGTQSQTGESTAARNEPIAPPCSSTGPAQIQVRTGASPATARPSGWRGRDPARSMSWNNSRVPSTVIAVTSSTTTSPPYQTAAIASGMATAATRMRWS